MKLLTWIGLICVLLSAASARASVIYSNLGPGDSFANGLGGYEYPAYANIGPIYAREISSASSFTTDSHSWRFEGIELPLEFLGGNNSFELLVATDSNGLPGHALQRIDLSGIPAEPTIVTVSASGALLLQPDTTYWIVLGVKGIPSYARCGWFGSVTATGNSAIDAGDGTGWIGGSVPAAAMRVNGTIVPEPSALVLASAVGTIVVVTRRARSDAKPVKRDCE